MNSSLQAEEFNIEAKEISVDKKNNIVTGKGSVVVTDQDGITVKADKIIYERSKEFLTAEGSVEVFDADNNLLTTDKATYDKTNEIKNFYDTLSCDLLCVSGGWTPTVHLFTQSRGKLIFRDSDATFLPYKSFQNEISVGSCNGTFDLKNILDETYNNVRYDQVRL